MDRIDLAGAVDGMSTQRQRGTDVMLYSLSEEGRIAIGSPMPLVVHIWKENCPLLDPPDGLLLMVHIDTCGGIHTHRHTQSDNITRCHARTDFFSIYTYQRLSASGQVMQSSSLYPSSAPNTLFIACSYCTLADRAEEKPSLTMVPDSRD